MAKSTTASFVLELRLVTHQNEQAVLEKRFAIAERIYNKVLYHAKTQLVELRKNRRYQELLCERRLAVQAKDAKQKNFCNKALQDIQQTFGLSEYALHAYIGRMRSPYKKHIDSFTAQKIATTVWKSLSDILYGKGQKVQFKKFGQLASLEGKSNATGIRFLGDCVKWNGLILPVKLRASDLFAQEVLASHRVKYCRIVRKSFKNGPKYFVQLVMEGIPPVKRNNDTGLCRRTPSPTAEVGVDIGTSTVAVSAEKGVILKELFPEAKGFDNQIRLLQRKLDRSQRATNPTRFNADDTVISGIRLPWVRSNHYRKIRNQLQDVYRRRAVALKAAHNRTANAILALGNQLYVEEMDFRALMKRAKETTVKPNGRFNRKGRFGKSIGYHAPAMLIAILKQKLTQESGDLHKVDTRTFRASQYNHVTDTYIKKTLDERVTIVDGALIQRDLYSAFLLKNSQPNLKATDTAKCTATFATFQTHHDHCVQTLCQSKQKHSANFGLSHFRFA
jgi:hypothetical protein